MTRADYKELPELLSTGEIVRHTGLSRCEVRKMYGAGIVKMTKTSGGQWRFHRSVLFTVFGLVFEDNILGEKRKT